MTSDSSGIKPNIPRTVSDWCCTVLGCWTKWG